MSTVWTFLVAWLPSPLPTIVLGIISVILVLIIVRVVGMILDAIPFL